jgi:hypothetical protein
VIATYAQTFELFLHGNVSRNDDRAAAQAVHSASVEVVRRVRKPDNAFNTYNSSYSRFVLKRRGVQRRRFGIDRATNGDGSKAIFSRDRAGRKRHGYAYGYDRSNDFGRLYARDRPWLRIRSRIRKFVDPNERPITCSSGDRIRNRNGILRHLYQRVVRRRFRRKRIGRHRRV